MYGGVKANEKHDGGNEKILGSSGDPLLTPYRPKILLFDVGKWGMHSGVKANEKHDGSNEKIVGSSGDSLLTPYRSLRGLKFYFWI